MYEIIVVILCRLRGCVPYGIQELTITATDVQSVVGTYEYVFVVSYAAKGRTFK